MAESQSTVTLDLWRAENPRLGAASLKPTSGVDIDWEGVKRCAELSDSPGEEGHPIHGSTWSWISAVQRAASVKTH